MPVEVNTAEAPALLRVRCVGPLPSAEEQRQLRQRLVSDGHLTENSVSLLDFRETDVPAQAVFLQSIAEAVSAGIPRRRACLINPGLHLPFLQQFQAAVPWMSTAAFIDEREALEWLLNPEGAAGFRR